MNRALCCTVVGFILLFVPACKKSEKQTQNAAKKTVTELLAIADIKVGGKRPWDITVHNDAFYEKVLTDGSLGLGESYMDGWWDTPHLDQFMFHLLRVNLSERVKPTWGMRWTYLKALLFNLQDKIGAKEVIDAHYQLGNDLYQEMLDPLMVYSCGYWKRATNLAQAQEAKFDLICRKMSLKPGMRVLDIGCGWGGFEKYAAEHYGVSVVGVTLSENQAEHARKMCEGLPVEILLQDYRDIEGSYDRIISIGMFEHVGKKNFKTYMQIVSQCLKPEGLFLLHTIGRDSSALVTDPWIHKYIFPNGQLPSIAQVGESIEKEFVLEDWHNFGADYDKTLMAWYENFNNAWPKLKDRYDARFYRMWKYYLLACAGGFRSRKIQLWQLVLAKDGIIGGYVTVR